ncbi:MAG: trypsin-like peptidase domain-containing protein [Planctomycetaceae bacterium]|nr:trypsin-like peptidase domain-containing protein [Planctomycetaceae bacterium]
MVSMQVALAALMLSGAGQTVLLDFYGDHCGPCRAMQPTVQALVDAGYPVQRINVEKSQNQALVSKYRIGPIPCFVMVVDGQEVDRVIGGTTYSRLERMCKTGTSAVAQASAIAQNTQNSPVQPASFNAPMPNAQQPLPTTPASPVDAAALAASVRIRVEDPDGHSCGSGTIIDARDGQALILTCGHIFRDSKGQGRIEVDLFGPNGPQQAVGRLVSYSVPDLNGAEGNAKPDLGLIAIQTPGPVTAARVAPPSYRVQPGIPVVSVGCNNGQTPSVQHSQVTSLNKFVGAPNVQVAGQPVEGRSGGGLFSNEGYMIGVCNAADPGDKEGLFAALGSIYAELDQRQLEFVYKSGENSTQAAPPASLAAVTPPPMPLTMPKSMPNVSEPLAMASMTSAAGPAGLRPQEQAALDEIRRRVKEGADVTIVIHPRNNPDAKSEVLMLDRASREFLQQLPVGARSKDRLCPTSLELPKPRRVLLEWSKTNQPASETDPTHG